MDKFKLVSPYSPTGDQPQAIDLLCAGLEAGMPWQTLLGITGSGKTFTMANVIARLNRPTLVLAHNKTLAAQLCTEFRTFFPENAVEFFVSYYDYYQPEAYVPGKDIYIEKDSSVNEEIDRLRHSATSALFERRDVIIVASVSCIFSLGPPEEYAGQVTSIRPGMMLSRDDVAEHLISIGYNRNDIEFARNKFRMKGDTLEVFPSNSNDRALRLEFFGDEIDRVSEINPVTGSVVQDLTYAAVYPANHYIVSPDMRESAYEEIEREMEERVEYFKSQNKLIEAQRIEERTRYDLEMLREIGYCSGIENYSREHAGVVLDSRAVADLAEHFEVVSRPLLDPLSLDQLVLRFEVLDPLLHLPFDLLVCALAHIRGHDVVIRGIYGGIGEILHDRAGDGIYLGHTVDLVAEEFEPQRAVV